jgi:hypothetical protein
MVIYNFQPSIPLPFNTTRIREIQYIKSVLGASVIAALMTCVEIIYKGLVLLKMKISELLELAIKITRNLIF